MTRKNEAIFFNALWSSGRVGNEVLCCKLLILLTRLKTTCFTMVSRCHVKARLNGAVDQNKEPRLFGMTFPGLPTRGFKAAWKKYEIRNL